MTRTSRRSRSETLRHEYQCRVTETSVRSLTQGFHHTMSNPVQCTGETRGVKGKYFTSIILFTLYSSRHPLSCLTLYTESVGVVESRGHSRSDGRRRRDEVFVEGRGTGRGVVTRLSTLTSGRSVPRSPGESTHETSTNCPSPSVDGTRHGRSVLRPGSLDVFVAPSHFSPQGDYPLRSSVPGRPRPPHRSPNPPQRGRAFVL